MEISPLEIYFIMQATEIKDGLQDLMFLGLVALAIIAIVVAMAQDSSNYEAPPGTFTKIIRYAIAVTFALGTTCFIPNSPALATIYLAPEIMNNEAITTEAKEIYGLMKEGLTDLVGKDE